MENIFVDSNIQNNSANKPLTVWVVDDTVEILAMVQDTINATTLFCCNETFVDCESAQQKLREGVVPEIILLDLKFSQGMNGTEALPIFHELAPKAKIIILSVDREKENVLTVFRKGIEGYICKPFDPEDIVNALNALARNETTFSAEVVHHLREALTSISSNSPRYEFTNQEITILPLIAQGLNDSAIAKQLSVSDHTIHNHIKHIYKKLSVNTRAEAVSKIHTEKLL